MDKFNLLPDQPLKSEAAFESAKFGHKEIAETLTSIIVNCPTPFTIGLFGRWGAGKSTISFMLQSEMATKKLGFVLFDVWKHESDALRRTFLKESLKQLEKQKRISKEFKLEDRVDSKITRKVEGEFQFKNLIKKYWASGLLIMGLFVLIGFIIDYFLGFDAAKNYISTIISLLTGGGILAVIVSKTMSYFLTSETITHEIDRFKDPHEFQSEFERLLSNLSAEKMLVVFDNLDRVTHEKAIEILTTIKTFLETENVKGKGVIFLIPCDDRAIKEHIKNVYKLSADTSDAFNEEEFLRKFFNASLRLPDFYPTELESFAMDLLKQTSIKALQESSVAWLVTKAYRQNPRQIKQFINQLINIYILAQKRVEKEFLPKEFLHGNVAKLAKFLILYNNFPNQLEGLRQQKIWDLDQIPQYDSTDGANTEFRNFLQETSHIPISNLDIFFTLRRSVFEIQLPGFDGFAAALQDNRVDEATAYLQALSEFSKNKPILSQAIKKLLGNTNIQDTKISIINACLTALNRLNERLEDVVYVEINNELLKLKQFLHIIEPAVIFNQLLRPDDKYRGDFAQIYVDLLSQGDEKSKLPLKFVEALILEITKNSDWFEEHISKISKTVSEKYFDQPQIIQILLSDEAIQKKFAVGEILQKTTSTLSFADLESGKPFDEKIQLLISAIPDVIDSQVISWIMVRFKEIFASENTKPADNTRSEIRKRLSKGITLLFKKHSPTLSKSSQPDKDALAQVVLQAINRFGDWSQRSIYIEPTIAILKISATLSAQLTSMVNQFITNTTYEGLAAAFEGRTEKEWNEVILDGNFSESFRQKALKDQRVFDHLYKSLEEERRRDWLLAMLDVDANRGIQKIESLDRDLPDITAILKKLLGMTGALDIATRQRIYDIADKFEFANDEELLQVAIENTKKYLKLTDEPNQKLGFELSTKLRSFKDSDKREIAKEVIEWLLPLQSDQLYQPHATNAVLQLWDIIKSIKGQTIFEKKFTEYIFRLILEGKNVNAIKQGMDALKIVKPPYNDDNAKNYDDLKRKTEIEPDATVKGLITQGFVEIKKLIDTKEPWWEWIEVETES